MVTTLEPAVSPKLAKGYQRMKICDVSWDTYEKIGEAFLNRANIRLTYDRGNLEIMTLSPEHERLKWLFGLLVSCIAEELNIRIGGFASTTYKQEEAEHGVEPDLCFYLANLDRVRGLNRLDLSQHPAPDFAIEIDVTHSSINRLGIYAGLGVPEVWRWDDGTITVHQLNEQNQYVEHETSSTFIAEFPVGELVQFLEMGRRDDDTTMLRAFRTWLRQLIADRGLTA